MFFAASLAVVALTSCGGGSKEEEADTTQVLVEDEFMVAEPMQEVLDSAQNAVDSAGALVDNSVKSAEEAVVENLPGNR